MCLDSDPRINAYGSTTYPDAKYRVERDLMREYNCTENQAILIMTLAFLNHYNYDFAINAVINEGAKKVLYNERQNEDGTYTYTSAYITNTDKLIGEEKEFTFYDQQNCYKEGNFTPLKI
jgi:hypothetical protein